MYFLIDKEKIAVDCLKLGCFGLYIPPLVSVRIHTVWLLFRNKYKSKLVIYLFRLSVIIFMIQAMLLSRPQNREDNAALTRLIHRTIFPLDLEVENFLFYFFHIKSNPKKILLLVHFIYNWENRKPKTICCRLLDLEWGINCLLMGNQLSALLKSWNFSAESSFQWNICQWQPCLHYSTFKIHNIWLVG